ncbi:hypothetical protein LOK49_LG11G01249 [Camellia lanceoleosa]|uniref:Uncharacterized protein n=1 Tax=Camellia lanceoleosa TaxID=1840588 RepID=A0ACC0G0I1_9ERIC|nr:hypothetical protein LOK49_LG11G01249 [Camellia lanceoleosa]
MPSLSTIYATNLLCFHLLRSEFIRYSLFLSHSHQTHTTLLSFSLFYDLLVLDIHLDTI